MRNIDLHTHTIYSDGTYSPQELMEYAAKKRLSAIAITDHDTVAGLDESAYWAKKYGVEFIPGVEIAALYHNIEIHIVGLFIDYKNQVLVDALEEMQNIRHRRNHAMIALFNKAGIPITYDELVAASGGKVITRAHFAKLLVEKGYSQTTKEAFKTYLNSKAPTFIKRKLFTSDAAIAAIHEAGGTAILAHPVLYPLTYAQIEALVKNLIPEIDGIEAIYSVNTEDDDMFLTDLAKKYTLKISGGSDFHGANKPLIDLGTGHGNLNISYDVLDQLK